MKVRYSPQRNDGYIIYEMHGEIITATVDGIVDVFDFSTMPEGVADMIETHLPINPIVSARRENGELWVELLQFHDAEASSEVLFPEWKVIDDGKN